MAPPVDDAPRVLHIQSTAIVALGPAGAGDDAVLGGIDLGAAGVVTLRPAARLGGVLAPEADDDAATKAYVDGRAAGGPAAAAAPFVITSRLAGRPQKLGDAVVPFGRTLAAPPAAVLTAWRTPTRAGPLIVTDAGRTDAVTLRYARCNYSVVGRVPADARYDVSYCELVPLAEPTHVGLVIATTAGEVRWYVWMTEPTVASDPVVVGTGIEPTQRLGAVRLLDGTVLLAVGSGNRGGRVHLWRSTDHYGSAWGAVAAFTGTGWCTNAILLADGRPAVACGPRGTAGAAVRVAASATDTGSWSAWALPATAPVATNVYSLARVAGGLAVVWVAPDGAGTGAYAWRAAEAAGDWTVLTPHARFVGADASKPTVAHGVPWLAVSGELAVFRAPTASGVGGGAWTLVRACAPGIRTFGPISAVVQPDGALTLGTGGLATGFYSVWTTDAGAAVSVEELPGQASTVWDRYAAGGGCLAGDGTLLVFVVIGLYFLLVYHVEPTTHQIVVIPAGP